jgi:hypothetical protein
VKHTEENAAKAAQESELVRVAGQIAASAYGGPGGAEQEHTFPWTSVRCD